MTTQNKALTTAIERVLALKQPSTVYMRHLGMGDAAFIDFVTTQAKLGENKLITELYLEENKLTDASAEVLAEALKTNTTLRSLYLSQNNLTDAGVKALAAALAHNTTLREVFLHLNKAVTEGALAVLEAALRASATIKVRNDIKKAVESKATRLELINHRAESKAWDELGELLTQATHVEYLTLERCAMGDEGALLLAKHIPKLPSLSLILSGNKLTDVGIAAITGALKHNTTTAWVSLGENPMTAKGVESVIDLLQHNAVLRNVSLSFVDKKHKAAFGPLLKVLQEHKTLQTIGVTGSVDDDVADAFNDAWVGNMKKLWDGVSAGLEQNTLTALHLAYVSINWDNHQALAAALAKNASLTHLDMRGNGFYDNTAELYQTALKTNTTLRSFLLPPATEYFTPTARDALLAAVARNAGGAGAKTEEKSEAKA